MSVDRNTAMRLWQDVFGSNIWGQDCFGSWMYRDDYGDKDKLRVGPSGLGRPYNYGWDVDHIRPISDFNIEQAAHFMNNYEPMHHTNNARKSNFYPHFAIGRERYMIVKCSICNAHEVPGYGIIKISSDTRVDWKGVKNKYYQR